MKNYILICLLSFMSSSFAEVTPWQKKFDTYTNGLPNDVIALLHRTDDCEHWGGEEPYSEARRNEITAAMKKLKCDDLYSEKKKILIKNKKIPKQPTVKEKVQKFPAALK